MPDNTKAAYFFRTTVSQDQETVRNPAPSYENSGTTAIPPPSSARTTAPEAVDPVVAWQMTRAAVRYRGRWVALDEASGRVIAVADTPTDFDEDATRDATLVFVRPSGPLVER